MKMLAGLLVLLCSLQSFASVGKKITIVNENGRAIQGVLSAERVDQYAFMHPIVTLADGRKAYIQAKSSLEAQICTLVGFPSLEGSLYRDLRDDGGFAKGTGLFRNQILLVERDPNAASLYYLRTGKIDGRSENLYVVRFACIEY